MAVERERRRVRRSAAAVRGRYRPSANANSNYDVATDGRFLLVQALQPTRPATRVEVVLNGLAVSLNAPALSAGVVVSLLVGLSAPQLQGGDSAIWNDREAGYDPPTPSASGKISAAAAKLELDNKTADAVALIETYLARHANDGEAHFVQARFYEDLAGFDPAARTPAWRKHLESAARHYLRAADLLPDLDARFVSLEDDEHL